MYTTDKFYIYVASYCVNSLMTATHADGDPVIFNKTIAEYLDPLAFMDHYTALPSDRWAGEFRRAHAVALELSERWQGKDLLIESYTVKEIAEMVILSLHILAKYDCPAVAGEMTQPDGKINNPFAKIRARKYGTAGDPGKDRQAEPARTPQGVQLPPEFETADPNEITAVLSCLANAGLLDENWQPLKGVQLKFYAYIAQEAGELLGIQNNYIKAFKELWNMAKNKSNFSSLIDTIKTDEKDKKIVDEIDSALCTAIRKTPSLLSSINGKNFIEETQKNRPKTADF